MPVKFTELIPLPRPVYMDAEKTKHFEIHALGITQLALFLNLYRPQMTQAFEIMRVNGDWTAFVMSFPEMVRDLIAAASDTSDEAEVAAIMKLPVGVQIMALSEIWAASVPDPKSLQDVMDRLNALARESVKIAPASISNVAILDTAKDNS